MKKAQFYIIASFFLVLAVVSYFFLAYNNLNSNKEEVQDFNSNCLMLYNELDHTLNYACYHNFSENKTIYYFNKTLSDFIFTLPPGEVKAFAFVSSNNSFFLSNFNDTELVLESKNINRSIWFDKLYKSSCYDNVYLVLNNFSYSFSNPFCNDSDVSLINVFLYLNSSGQIYVCKYSPNVSFH